MSITPDAILNQQLIGSANCIPTYDQFLVGTRYPDNRFTIEAVDGGGFVVRAHFPAKGNQTRVAIGLESLTCLLKEWIVGAK